MKRIVRAARGALTLPVLAALLLPTSPTTAWAATVPSPGGNSVGSCSWQAPSNPDTINLAYPDLDATYWSHTFAPVPGEMLVIKGQYPAARYFSFHVYASNQVTLDSVYDAQIMPDSGSSNPFVAAPVAGSGNTYTEYVQFTPKPSRPAPNTVYVNDIPQGAPTPSATLMYRVYVPTDDSDAAGGPMPRLTLETTSGSVIDSYDACANSGVDTGGQVNQEIQDSNYPAGAPTPPIEGATNPPTWSRAFSSSYYGLDGNSQNAYLTATISRQFGGVVVIHGEAPTFPDTRAGVPAYTPSQLRYWSICENSNTTRVISCAADYHAAIQDGYYTYVISDPDARPANATAANGVTWLPWGGVFPNGTLIYRNMLPSPGFTNAVQDVTQTGVDSNPLTAMGPYFPQTAYCSTATFEVAGWQGCLAGSDAIGS